MYLSKYQIDIRSRAGRQLLSSNNRQILHQVVLGKLFGETAMTHHILFRATGQDLYVQSDIPPQYTVEGLKLIYTKERDSSIQKLKAGDVVRFNLMAMPAKSVSQPRKEDGTKPRGRGCIEREERHNEPPTVEGNCAFPWHQVVPAYAGLYRR